MLRLLAWIKEAHDNWMVQAYPAQPALGPKPRPAMAGPHVETPNISRPISVDKHVPSSTFEMLSFHWKNNGYTTRFKTTKLENVLQNCWTKYDSKQIATVGSTSYQHSMHSMQSTPCFQFLSGCCFFGARLAPIGLLFPETRARTLAKSWRFTMQFPW